MFLVLFIVSSRFFKGELQRKLVEFDMSVCLSVLVRVNGFIGCFAAIQRRGRKSETRWKPLEIEFDCCCCLLLLLHNLECYRTIGTEKEERIEENPVYSGC